MDRFDKALAFSMNYLAPGLDPNRTCATGEELRILREILRTDQPSDYPCPYCKATKCGHWDGTGWVKDGAQPR